MWPQYDGENLKVSENEMCSVLAAGRRGHAKTIELTSVTPSTRYAAHVDGIPISDEDKENVEFKYIVRRGYKRDVAAYDFAFAGLGRESPGSSSYRGHNFELPRLGEKQVRSFLSIR